MVMRIKLVTDGCFGQIGEFKPDEERVSAYLERMQLFFVPNSIAENKQVAMLLSVVSPKAYALLRDLLAPSKPQHKSHYEPKPIVIRTFSLSSMESSKWRIRARVCGRVKASSDPLSVW